MTDRLDRETIARWQAQVAALADALDAACAPGAAMMGSDVAAAYPQLLVAPAPPRADIREADFQALIVDLAERLGWWTFHVLESRGSNHGWGDLTLLRYEGPRAVALFREVKTERGKLRPDQLRVGQMLMAAGLDWQVWRPADWPSICDTLAKG